MEKYIYKLIWTYSFFISLAWTIYTIFSSWGTNCFDMKNSYITIIVLLFELIWSNFIKPASEEE
ncbi:MAG: hypothetical protein A3D39_00105 [Candidatus Buchananbacteria bacterium RIFCSPHIGHO2_02_FULL_39_17]|uniref:Uncharacterized protein n=1 Tax=Candidatus Buchananbacteria bacterium RIFCSPLOWO2_01_FULL_40_23b TaxID=1797544 RepID=A0A1G1YWL3_9BACT|nr:MAG: hypothetical protein A3D39_00105 [Candidatus Buchananbacteria bacterium RIFCSPHIGHO2_02_FULL_39_17]OGY55787.1 MAG: hypothetical protein A2912_01015 [Candidatus Buchananbacteria bacterium RIFCSPLOWO2_01_FULL_40_23b]